METFFHLIAFPVYSVTGTALRLAPWGGGRCPLPHPDTKSAAQPQSPNTLSHQPIDQKKKVRLFSSSVERFTRRCRHRLHPLLPGSTRRTASTPTPRRPPRSVPGSAGGSRRPCAAAGAAPGTSSPPRCRTTRTGCSARRSRPPRSTWRR